MHLLHCTTFIKAPVEIVFKEAGSIFLHKQAWAYLQAAIVSDKVFGQLAKDDNYIWNLKLLNKPVQTKISITNFATPKLIEEDIEMPYLKQCHVEQHFKPCDNGTIYITTVNFLSKWAPIGLMFVKLFLLKRLNKLFVKRIEQIKQSAEKLAAKAAIQKLPAKNTEFKQYEY